MVRLIVMHVNIIHMHAVMVKPCEGQGLGAAGLHEEDRPSGQSPHTHFRLLPEALAVCLCE